MASKRTNRKTEGEEVEAKSAKVVADSITKPVKIRMSNVHHGSRSEAEGNVEIEIKTQYPNAGGEEKRPPAGTIIKADKATIQARQIIHLEKKGGRERITASDNVGIFWKLRRRS